MPLLVELRLQRIHALSTGPLAFLLPLFADRLALRLLHFLGGSPVRVQFRYDLIEGAAHNRATLLPLRRLYNGLSAAASCRGISGTRVYH